MYDIAEKGWQWFSIQLDDETDIICRNTCDLDGTVNSSDLTMMQANGSVYHTTEIELEATDSWELPDTDETYGMTWTLRELKRDLDLKIEARFPGKRSFY
jgi:predicted secreted hydrolase